MRTKKSFAGLLAALLLMVCGIALAQNASQNRTLIVVNGNSGNVPVIMVNGRSYVDLEGLANAINGSLTYSGNEIALTLPSSSGNANSNGNSNVNANPNGNTMQSSAPTSAPAPQSNPGFSQGFLTAGIEQMGTVREWHSALASAIQNGTPIAAGWLAPYRAQAQMNLRLAQTAIQTNSDRRAFQLLTNEFQNMAKLSDKYIAKRDNLSYISPNALQDDSLNQSIVACGRSLGAMAASGQFVDDGSCAQN
jgi:hypothetical protein